MKNLLLMLALSFVMVAYDKDEYRDNRELSYWDKVASEMTRTKMSAAEVLNSLQDNEFWYKNASSNFFNKNGKEIEVVHQPEGALMIGDSFMRFVDNTVYFISMNPMPTNGVGWVYVDYDAEIVGDNHIKFYFEGKEVFEWKIIAHDNDKIVINTYYKGQQQPDKKYGEFLYSRKLFIRKTDETKCWENAKPYK